MRAACIQFLNEQDIAEASCVWFEMMISIVFSAILRCRYKILNPEKFRGTYGKLIHMLQDSVKERKLIDFGARKENHYGRGDAHNSLIIFWIAIPSIVDTVKPQYVIISM